MNSKRPVMWMDSVRWMHATRVRRLWFQMFQSTSMPGLRLRILAASSLAQTCGSRSEGPPPPPPHTTKQPRHAPPHHPPRPAPQTPPAHDTRRSDHVFFPPHAVRPRPPPAP